MLHSAVEDLKAMLWSSRCSDNGVRGSVWRQLQRGSVINPAVRLVLLARRSLCNHVPSERHLHGVCVERHAEQGQVIGSGAYPQTPGGRVCCLVTRA